MASSKCSTKWLQLSKLPESYPNYVFNAHSNEFIAIYKTYPSLKSYKYNVETDIFNTFIEYNNKLGIHDAYNIRNVTFNEKDQMLFVERRTQIDSINILTNNKKRYNLNSEQEIPYGKYFLSINNYIHIITAQNRHWIGKIENNILKTLCNTIDNSETEREDGVAIYVPSKQCILLIGGYDDDDAGPCTNEIWKYCLSSQKWIQMHNINGEFNCFGFAAVLTSNQRYIILFGGWKYDEEKDTDYKTNDIYVLDMNNNNNWKIKQSKIKCPDIGRCFGVRTCGIDSKHELLVIGFVKKCFKMKQFYHLSIPPFYIINIITKYFSAEMLHYIKKNKHYGIYLKHILSSLYD